MQILSLELENAKSFAHALIEFTEGINAIVGHNGAGKSTILEAIGFSLFDALDYTHSDFVRESARSATVTTTFASSLDERQYQAVRRCGSSNQYYVHDPELGIKICEGKADVQSFLRQHMGLEAGANLSRLFRDAVGVPQGTLTAAFLLPANQRKSIFDPLLRVEEYRQAFERLLDAVRLLRDRQQTADVEIAGLVARVERLPELRATVQRRRVEIAEAERAKQSATNRLQETEQQRVALEAARQLRTDLANQIAQSRQRKGDLTQRLSGAEAALTQAESARAAIVQHQEGHDRYLAAQAREKELGASARARSSLVAEGAALDKQLAVSNTERARLQQELAAIAAAEGLVEKLALAVSQQSKLEEDLVRARQERAHLGDAASQLDKLRRQLQHLAEQRSALADQLAQTEILEAARAATTSRIEELRQTLEGHNEASARYKVQADAIKVQNDMLSAAETPLCPVCEQPLEPHQRAALIDRNTTELETLRANYRALQADVRSGQAEQQQLTQELERMQRVQRELPRPQEVANLEATIAAHEQEIVVAERQMAALVDAPGRVADLEVQLHALGNPRQQHAVAQDRAGQRSHIEERQRHVDSELNRFEAQIAGVQSRLAVYVDLDKEIHECAAQVEQHAAAYRMVLSNRQTAETVEARLREVESLRNDLAAAAEQTDRLATQLAAAEAAFDEVAYQAAVRAEQTLREERAALETGLTMMSRDQHRDETEITVLERHMLELSQARARRGELDAQVELLETVRNVIKQAGPFVTRTLIRQISDGAARIFGDIMQDYSRHLAWNEEYDITLNVDGYDRQFGQLSGGEQMSAALAVRLALLREMSTIDVAFFDEPTANLDDVRRESLARQILNVRGFRQLFVISHDDTFEQATQNLVRVERVHGQSVVSRE